MKGSFNRLAVGVAILAGLALNAAPARAESINFLSTGRGTSVSIAGPVRSGTFHAGELRWEWEVSTPEDWAREFYSYCVDVGQNLRDPQYVTRRTTDGFMQDDPSTRVYTSDGGARAAFLVNQFALDIRNDTNTSRANVNAAALQVAIWEVMYDSTYAAGTFNSATSTYTGGTLSDGFFQLANGSLQGAVRRQAELYLDSLYGDEAGQYNTSTARLLEATSGQDQIVTSVSEPSTLLLMGVAFLVFANRARRHTQSINE